MNNNRGNIFTIFAFAAIALIVAMAFVPAGYAYSSSVTSEGNISSSYNLIYVEKNGEMSDKMFENVQINYENGEIRDTMLVNGTLDLVLISTEENADISFEVSVDGSESASITVEASFGTDTEYFGEGSSVSKAPGNYKIYLKMTATNLSDGTYTMTVTFKAVSKVSGTYISSENTASIHTGFIIHPSSDDKVHIKYTDDEYGPQYPTADITYDDTSSAVPVAPEPY